MKHVVAGLLTLACAYALVPTADAEDRGGVRPGAEGTAGKDAKAKKKKLSDAEIKQILIDESIAAYTGHCPCPYNTASNGSRCGGRSAYSRKGGAEPLCYPKDVSAQMVREYRDAHPEE